MTGYAGRNFAFAGLGAKITIKSLNHRFFDWSYKGAPLGELEGRLRTLAQKRLQRGRVEASVDLLAVDPEGWQITVNDGLLEKILTTLEKASRRMGKPVTLSVDNIFRIPQVVELRRKDLNAAESAFLERSFDRTLEDVLRQRRREGRETARRINRHLSLIHQGLRRIEKKAKSQPSLFRHKLKERLKETDGGIPVPGGKLEEEAALLAQRADIAEEILRLQSHLAAFTELAGRERSEPVGKMLDFLSQEISREVNTINSKSQDIGIVRASLLIKGEVESIRQHVQNIE
jgi:uncharacterized protein (TIGR00255 family)